MSKTVKNGEGVKNSSTLPKKTCKMVDDQVMITKEEFENELKKVVEEQVDIFVVTMLMYESWENNENMDEKWLNEDNQSPIINGIGYDVYRNLSEESQKFVDDNELNDTIEFECERYYEVQKEKYLKIINEFYDNFVDSIEE